jgi:hypothetical protein
LAVVADLAVAALVSVDFVAVDLLADFPVDGAGVCPARNATAPAIAPNIAKYRQLIHHLSLMLCIEEDSTTRADRQTQTRAAVADLRRRLRLIR